MKLTRQHMAGIAFALLLIAVVVLHVVGGESATDVAERLEGAMGLALAALLGETVVRARAGVAGTLLVVLGLVVVAAGCGGSSAEAPDVVKRIGARAGQCIADAIEEELGAGGEAPPIEREYPAETAWDQQTTRTYEPREGAYDMDDTDLIEACARAAHEVNRAYCQALGDDSQPPWDEAPAWQQASARVGAGAVLADPAHGPERSHQTWLRRRRAEGWVWGTEKNPDATPPTHPCMVEFAELSEAQRAKDHLFVAVVRATARAIKERERSAFDAGFARGTQEGAPALAK